LDLESVEVAERPLDREDLGAIQAPLVLGGGSLAAIAEEINTTPPPTLLLLPVENANF